MKLLSDFFRRRCEFIAPESGQGGGQGPHMDTWRALGGWHAPLSMWPPGGSFPVLLCSSIFYIFQNKSPKIPVRFRALLFLHKNNTMAILLKTALVRVSFTQIMQIRGQNKSKSVWKSRYVGDVSTPPSLTHCLSSSNSVDKLKVIKKNFYKLICFCRCT